MVSMSVVIPAAAPKSAGILSSKAAREHGHSERIDRFKLMILHDKWSNYQQNPMRASQILLEDLGLDRETAWRVYCEPVFFLSNVTNNVPLDDATADGNVFNKNHIEASHRSLMGPGDGNGSLDFDEWLLMMKRCRGTCRFNRPVIC